jgi:hypothetical protein
MRSYPGPGRRLLSRTRSTRLNTLAGCVGHSVAGFGSPAASRACWRRASGRRGRQGLGALGSRDPSDEKGPEWQELLTQRDVVRDVQVEDARG